MSSTLVALIPVLGRPQNVQPLIDSYHASLAREDVEASLLFLCSPGDEAEIAELTRLGQWHVVVSWAPGHGDFALKINAGASMTNSEWVFVGADDLRFHPGWFAACLRTHAATGALVIGTNDLGNPKVKRGQHATHWLVHRDYLTQGTIDEPGKLLHDGYQHNCVDIEAIETAIWRRTWAFAADAQVEHLHPLWRKGTHDATYALGQREHLADLNLLRERGHLWHHRDVTVMLQRGRRHTIPGAANRQIRLR